MLDERWPLPFIDCWGCSGGLHVFVGIILWRGNWNFAASMFRIIWVSIGGDVGVQLWSISHLATLWGYLCWIVASSLVSIQWLLGLVLAFLIYGDSCNYITTIAIEILGCICWLLHHAVLSIALSGVTVFLLYIRCVKGSRPVNDVLDKRIFIEMTNVRLICHTAIICWVVSSVILSMLILWWVKPRAYILA